MDSAHFPRLFAYGSSPQKVLVFDISMSCFIPYGWREPKERSRFSIGQTPKMIL